MLYDQYFIDDLKSRAGSLWQIGYNRGLPSLRYFLAPMLLLLAASWLQAQIGSQPIQLDEFDRPNCEALRARMDAFHIQLANNPEAVGYVFIIGDAHDMRGNVVYEGMIGGYNRERQIPSDRIRMVHAPLESKLRIELWLVPKGASPPLISAVQWDYKIPKLTRSYIFTWDALADDICPDFDGVPAYVEFLKANPNANGNIVIRDTSLRIIRQLRHSVLRKLTIENSLPISRLRIFEIHKRPTGMLPRVEYWIVP